MKYLGSSLIVFMVLIGLHCEYGVDGVELEKDLALTKEQKHAMDQFRKLMKPKLPHRYMQEEIYLVRWLRARNFDVKKAEELLLDNLRWRKREGMDRIHLEKFDDIKHDFPYTIGDSFDKRGQPVVTLTASKGWDIRKAAVTGKIKRVLKYIDKAIEEGSIMLRRMQLEGKNVTQVVLLLHLGNFNLYQHGCARCVTGILQFIDSYENHYPGIADKIIFVQTPPVFESIARIIREATSPYTKEALKIYGLEPKVWKKALLDIINADQLPEEFGGTRKDDDWRYG